MTPVVGIWLEGHPVRKNPVPSRENRLTQVHLEHCSNVLAAKTDIAAMCMM